MNKGMQMSGSSNPWRIGGWTHLGCTSENLQFTFIRVLVKHNTIGKTRYGFSLVRQDQLSYVEMQGFVSLQ
jgi:hypothetical protein